MMKFTLKITIGDEIIFFVFVASSGVSCFLFDSLQVADIQTSTQSSSAAQTKDSK